MDSWGEVRLGSMVAVEAGVRLAAAGPWGLRCKRIEAYREALAGTWESKEAEMGFGCRGWEALLGRNRPLTLKGLRLGRTGVQEKDSGQLGRMGSSRLARIDTGGPEEKLDQEVVPSLVEEVM
jgi:hypothetical protein